MDNNIMLYIGILITTGIVICLQLMDKIKIKKIIFSSIIDESLLLSKAQSKIENRLNLFSTDIKKSKTISYVIVQLIVLNTLINTIAAFFIKEVWYTNLLNVILASIIPIVITKNIMESKYRNVIKSLNEAFSEMQYWLYRTNNISETIDKTAESLVGPIKKPFETLALYIKTDRNKAFDKFKDTFNNIYINQLIEILKSYLEFGGSIEELNLQITDINTKMHSENMFQKRVTERLFKFKCASIFMIICAFESKDLLLKLFPVELIQQTGVTVSNNKFTFIVLYFILLYFAIDLFERY